MLKETAILSTVNTPGSQLTPKTTIAKAINSTMATNDGFQGAPKTTSAISTPVSAMTPLSMKSLLPIQLSASTSNSFKRDLEGLKKIPSKISTKLSEEGGNGKPALPSNSLKEPEDNNVIKKVHSRPLNPFAKTPTSNEEKPSIFDSLKTTKKNEDVKKDVSDKVQGLMTR